MSGGGKSVASGGMSKSTGDAVSKSDLAKMESELAALEDRFKTIRSRKQQITAEMRATSKAVSTVVQLTPLVACVKSKPITDVCFSSLCSCRRQSYQSRRLKWRSRPWACRLRSRRRCCQSFVRQPRPRLARTRLACWKSWLLTLQRLTRFSRRWVSACHRSYCGRLKFNIGCGTCMVLCAGGRTDEETGSADCRYTTTDRQRRWETA